MKYIFVINHVGIVKNNLHNVTDLVDWVIIDYLKDWYFSGYAKKISITDAEKGEHTDYVWVNYRHMIEALTMLKFDKDAISYRMKKLRRLGLIKTYQAKDNSLYFILTEKCIEVCFYREKEHPVEKMGDTLSKKWGTGGVEKMGDSTSSISYQLENNNSITNTPNFSNSVCSQTEEDVSFVVEKKTGVDEPNNADLVKQDRKNPLNNIPAYLLDIPLVEKTLQKKSYYPAGFEVFWAVYPRTDGKKAAFKAWKKLEKEGISLENVLKHTKEYVSSVREIKYMKHASSFLNQWDFHSDDKIEHITEEVLKEWVEWL